MSNTVLDIYRMKPVKGRAVIKTTKVPPIILNPSLICGIELEIENVTDYHLSKIPSAWRVTEDHSLRNNGQEFISSPTEVGRLCEDLLEFFSVTEFTEDNYSDRTSTHVHVNVQDFTKEQLQSLLVVYALVEKVLFDFVGHHRAENLYCVPLNETMLLQDLKRTLDRVFIGERSSWEKYTALNLKPIQTQGTVEFRHMHGTPVVEKLWLWLALLSNLVSYARKTTVEEVYEVIANLSEDKAPLLFNAIFPTGLEYTPHVGKLFQDSLTSTKYLLTQVNSKERPKSTEVPLSRANPAMIFDELDRVSTAGGARDDSRDILRTVWQTATLATTGGSAGGVALRNGDAAFRGIRDRERRLMAQTMTNLYDPPTTPLVLENPEPIPEHF